MKRSVLLLAVLAGCSGKIYGPSQGNPGTPGPAVISPHSMTPAVIRRLTNTEYDNTVRDLLGDTTAPATSFPPDALVGFDNISDVLTTSPLLVQGYLTAAQALIPAALANAAVGPTILTCDPAQVGATVCAQQAIAAFGAKVWRRPLTATEVASLVSLVSQNMTAGDAFQDALSVALEAMLVSVNFLYRPEIDPPNTSGTPHLVGQYEMASRLSYFLWSSLPDDALFAAAAANQLQDPAQLQAQAQRMLADPKHTALLDNLTFEWLGTRSLQMAQPAPPPTFPAFTSDLRGAMERETRLVLGEFYDNDEDLMGLLSTNFTYVDAALAQHYGISGVTSSTPVRVTLTGAQRGGILTHGAYLTSNSTPSRSSPTRRGKWVLSQLLCINIPPPPPNVPALMNENVSGSLRQQLQEHVNNPVCAACHGKMDPIGFALEHFDGVGMWRDTDTEQGGTFPIDATGNLPDGTTFNGALSLEAALQNESGVPPCITQQVWTYAQGRVPVQDDLSGIGAIATAAQAGGFSLRELSTQIVLSDSFRNRISP